MATPLELGEAVASICFYAGLPPDQTALATKCRATKLTRGAGTVTAGPQENDRQEEEVPQSDVGQHDGEYFPHGNDRFRDDGGGDDEYQSGGGFDEASTEGGGRGPGTAAVPAPFRVGQNFSLTGTDAESFISAMDQSGKNHARCHRTIDNTIIRETDLDHRS